MLERLKYQYPEESVFDAVNRLEQFAQLGLLLSEESQSNPLTPDVDRRVGMFQIFPKMS